MADINDLLSIIARLRDPEAGCPWDRKQTYSTIVPHTIEEAYEVADAIAREDYADLRDELGDLLLQVVFYSQIAREEGRFSFDDVVRSISDKLIRRHPHVFSDISYETEAEQKEAWEALKAEERDDKHGQPQGRLAGVATALPSLQRSVKLQKRAARAGFDWPDSAPVFDKIHEELNELTRELYVGAPVERLQDELGDVLFAVTNLCRHLKVEPDTALRSTNRKFERRFAYMEERLEQEGRQMEDCSLDELEVLWQSAKSGVETDAHG
jgi:ATP diphosphatase